MLWALCAANVYNPGMFRTLSLRAKDVPLHLTNLYMGNDERGGGVSIPRLPEYFYSNYSNAQAIRLLLGREHGKKWAKIITSEGIPPTLHTLQLARTDTERERPRVELDVPSDVPSTPCNLQHVLLSWIFVPLPSHNLVSLRLFHMEDEGSARTTPVMLAMLSRATNLQSLWLCDWACDVSRATTPSLILPNLLELILRGPSIVVSRSNTALMLYLTSESSCPRLKRLSCEGVLNPALTVDHSGAKPDLRRLLAALRISDDHFRGSPCIYSLGMWGHQRYHGDYRLTIQLGDLLYDDHLSSLVDSISSTPNTWRKDPARFRTATECLSTSADHDPSALHASSAFSLTDVDFGFWNAAHIFQTVVTEHASQHEGRLSAVEVLHLDVHFPTQGVDWAAILEPFTSARTLILVYNESTLFQEEGLIQAVTRAALGGKLLLPSLNDIRTDQRVPWRARDMSAIRAFNEARTVCGAPPLRIRPLNENEWKPAVLSYFDSLV